ncbi:MAG: long-chain fatty acid--CoA ligase [Bacteroidota bacterium]
MASETTYDNRPWLSSYESGIQANLEYKDLFIPQFLEQTVNQFPNNTALNFQGFKISFSELNNMVGLMAAVYKEFGIQKGDSVAILLPNLIPTVVAQYAALRLGAVVVMNNPLYSDREIKHQLNDSNAKILVTLDLLGNRMIDLMPETKLNQIIYTSIGDYLPFPKSILFPLVAKKKKLAAKVKPAKNVHKWKEILMKYSPIMKNVDLKADDPSYYQYTGGTTGLSKGAVLTHGNMGKQIQQMASWFPALKMGEEKMLGALPFFHVFGLTTSMNFAMYLAWENVLVPKPVPDALLEAISKHRVSFAPMVPTMYIGILNHPKVSKTDISSIKGCFSGSAPLPVEVLKEFEAKTGATIVEGFGLTESSPVSHINPFAGGERKVGSVGIPIPDTECRIVDLEDDSKQMPVGESGELIMRGPQIMQGYLNQADATAETLHNGWLHTGDIATMDKDGYFYIVDRKKDMIISGGYNIFPREIDEVYYEHPKVTEACAIGIPHEKRGESAKVYIVLNEGETATEEEMIGFAQDKLAKYKWPVEIEFVKDLPKSAVGKILRKELRAHELEKRKQI